MAIHDIRERVHPKNKSPKRFNLSKNTNLHVDWIMFTNKVKRLKLGRSWGGIQDRYRYDKLHLFPHSSSITSLTLIYTFLLLNLTTSVKRARIFLPPCRYILFSFMRLNKEVLIHHVVNFIYVVITTPFSGRLLCLIYIGYRLANVKLFIY